MSYFVHESSYVDDNVTIGDNTKIWFFNHIQSGAKIGSDCTIGQNVNVANDAVIGDRCKIQNNVSVYEGVILEDDVFCGPSMVFTNDYMPRATIRRDYLKTIVHRGASIGANATIVCGNEIGSWALIGSGAGVTKDVPAYAIMAGNPAQRIGWICECGLKLGDDLVCSCGKRYRKVDDRIEEVE